MDIQLFYRLISEGLEIPLGVADKLLINRMVRDRNPHTLDDIYVSSVELLTRMGYESSELTILNKKRDAYVSAFAEYMLNRYEKSKKLNL
jgi:hypothetical protein